MSDELSKIQAELKELENLSGRLTNKIKAQMEHNGRLNVSNKMCQQIEKCAVRIDELKRLEKPLKDAAQRKENALKVTEEKNRPADQKVNDALKQLFNKNAIAEKEEERAKKVFAEKQKAFAEKVEKELQHKEELRLLGLQAEKEFEEFEEELRLLELQAEEKLLLELQAFELQAAEKLLLESQAEKEFEEEKNKLILILSGEIPPLVEPYLDKLLLKKKQLVRVDDYGNVDWSFFIKELRYFVEKNIKTKIDIPEYIENIVLEIVGTLIFDYENNTQPKVRNLDDVSPIDFEHECADLLNQTGWTARVTQASGDQGIDVIATYGNVKAVFQVKKYSQPVGNSAVQEIIAGKAFEQAHVAAVVTNVTYTASAKQLAGVTGVFLLHYSELPNFAETLGLIETE